MGGARDGWRPADAERQDGVRVREFGSGPRIEIDFRYRGVRCRECLKVDVTRGNYTYAVRLRAEILNAIERKTFRYGDYFPDSPKARMFGSASSQTKMQALLEDFIDRGEKLVSKGKLSPSTFTGYKKITLGQLFPAFGTLRAADLTPARVRDELLTWEVTAKTLRNRLSVLRLVLDDAVDAGVIEFNPLDRLKLDKIIERASVESDFEIEPFDTAERAAFLKACRDDEERDLYTFWFETGLRPGELIALAWPKVDWIHGVVRIDRSIVERVEKGPKTAAGVRDVELSPDARAALDRQKARTFLAGGKVWRSPHNLEPFVSDAQVRGNSYEHVMKKAGVRWRNMYQIRHTFASTHASAGKNLFWLAQQMGHETIEMLIRHYARWIPGFAPDGHGSVTQKSGAEIIRFKARR